MRILGNNRVVFNIQRQYLSIDRRREVRFPSYLWRFVGTHEAYDGIDTEEIGDDVTDHPQR